MANYHYGNVLGAEYSKNASYSNITEVNIGDKVTFLDARHLGLMNGNPRHHYCGEVIEINALSKNCVTVRMQKFNPATNEILSDQVLIQSWPLNRWAPLDAIVRQYQVNLVINEGVDLSQLGD